MFRQCTDTLKTAFKKKLKAMQKITAGRFKSNSKSTPMTQNFIRPTGETHWNSFPLLHPFLFGIANGSITIAKSKGNNGKLLVPLCNRKPLKVLGSN